MSRSTTVGAALAVLFVAMGGCLGGDAGAKAIEPVQAPHWEPGFTWVYDAVESSTESYVEDGRVGGDSDRDRKVITVSVINTTQPFLDEDVYYLRLSDTFDSPLFQGTLQAVSKHNLQTAGYGYDDYGGYRPVHPPQPAVYAADGVYIEEPARHDPCEGVSYISYVPPEERLPAMQFPLDDGNSWSGDIVTGDDDFYALHYTGRVHGLVQVTVPAGTFAAIYSTVDFRAELPEGLEEHVESFDVSFRSETWYSPDVRQVVKNVATVRAEGALENDASRFSFAQVSSMALRSFDLTAGADEPAPRMYDERAHEYVEPVSWRIVTDTPLPVNVANGPTTMEFGLVATSGRSYHYSSTDDPVKVVGDVTAPGGLDPATHRIYWRVWTYSGAFEPVTGYGTTFNVTIERGGVYQVDAEVQPLECGGPWLGSVAATVPTIWEKTFQIAMETGLPGSKDVASVPIEDLAHEGVATWKLTPSLSPLADTGRPVMVSPKGTSQTVGASAASGTGSFPTYPAGTWKLQWQSQNPTVGDDVTLTLTIRYGFYEDT